MQGETAGMGLGPSTCTQQDQAVTEPIRAQREFIALDLETTGLTARTDRIVEIGAIRFLDTGQEIARYQSLVNPERPMPAAAYAIHGLTDQHLADARVAREVLPEFLEFLGNPGTSVLLAHHAWFDAGFLGCELSRAGMESPGHFLVDTLAMARRRLPQLRSHRLDFLTMHFGLDPEGSHRAIGDSRRVKEIWLRLGGALESGEVQVSYPILDARDSSWVPTGWEPLKKAAALGCTVRIEYEGGTRGAGPRLVTPRHFVQRGGYHYMVAFCHLDSVEKSFRLDRIRRFDLQPEAAPVDQPMPSR
jgi:DNA polymerase III epsilon subunit family exonuclease